MPPRYDMLVIDLDGTLLGPDGRVPEANVRAVTRREAGLEVVIATGRALVEARGPIDAIEHTGVVVAAGGSIVSDATTGHTIERSAMSVDLVRDVSRTIVDHGHKALLLKDGDAAGYDYLAVGPGALDPASSWWFEALPVRVRFVHDVDEDPHPEDTVRAGAVADDHALRPLAAWLVEEIGQRAFLQHWPAVTSSSALDSTTHLLEVFNPDVNKWTAVAAQCARRGIDGGRVVAIGDGLNDVEIVREAGLGVAMGNADERVRAVADRETLTSAEAGVAHAIDHILAGRW